MTQKKRRRWWAALWLAVLAFLRSLRRKSPVSFDFAWLIVSLITINLTFNIMASGEAKTPSSPPRPGPSIFPDSAPPGPNGPTSWDTATVDAHDDSGRAVRVRIGVLNDNYRWLIGSTKYVGITSGDSMQAGDALVSLRKDVDLPVVVLGMASHENALENPDDEDFRAQTRADELAQFAIGHFTRSPDIYKVNLGAYLPRETTSKTSAVERRVVVLQITCGDDAADLQTGVQNALREAATAGKTSFDSRRYKNFEPGRFRLQAAATGAKHHRPFLPCPPEESRGI